MTRRAPLILALLLGGGLSAQAEEERHGRFRFGPLHLTPTVVLTRYSGLATNGYGAEADLSADDVTTLTPSLRGAVPVGRRLRLRGNTAAYFGLFVREEDAFSFKGHSNWGGGDIALGRLALFGGVGRGRSKEIFVAGLDERTDRHEDSASAGMSLRLTRRLAATGSWTRRRSTYERPPSFDEDVVSKALDRESTTHRYQVNCALTRLTTLTFSADVIDDLFLDDETRVRSHRYLAGFTFSPLAFLRGRVHAGYRTMEEGQGVSSYTGTILSVGATMPFFHFGTLGGSAERDTTYLLATSAGEPQRNTVLINRYRGELRAQLPLSLVGAGHYAIHRIDNLGAAGAQSVTARKLRRYGGSLFRAFGPTLRIGGTVETTRPEGAPSASTHYFLSAEWTP